MRRSRLLVVGGLALLALLATTLTVDAAPKIATIEVKGMVCSA